MFYVPKRPSWRLPENASTDESTYIDRRKFLRRAGIASLAAGLGCSAKKAAVPAEEAVAPPELPLATLSYVENSKYADAGRPPTPERLATRFNNFYEFSYSKEGVKEAARGFKLDSYTLEIDGLAGKPLTLDLDRIEKLGLEQRVYRFRCVEAWSMVVPWIGVPLASILALAEPKTEAKFASFTSFHDPSAAPNQKDTQFQWPYYEGLRMEEAMNDLAFVATGIYGKRLPPQNGAPLRLAIPWKYGFKGAKSLVRITLTAAQPRTFWNDALPAEYTFEANVDPEVAHPRWSQAAEWRLETGQTRRYPTLKYNGYGEEVAHLYA